MSTSNEQPPTTERDDPKWEFQLSWEQLLVATLERKVITADEPYDPSGNENHEKDFPRRFFKTPSAEVVNAWGWLSRTNGQIDHLTTWSMEITPPVTATNSAPTPYRLDIQTDEEDQYRVMQEGSDIPLAPEAVESLLGTVATMIPTGPTEYLTRE